MNRTRTTIPPFAAIGDLAALLDPSSALALLVESGIPADRVGIDYLRIKPGESALAGLRIEGRGPGDDPASVLGYVRTFVACDRAETIARKWSRMRPRETPFGQGVRLLPGGRSVLFLFPNDMRLRGLPFVADMDKVKRILAEASGIGGAGWRVRGRKSAILPVRYKPERRYIARLRLALRDDARGEKERNDVFLRFFTDARGNRIERIARRLHEVHPHPPVARPLGTALGGRIFLEEAIDGTEIGSSDGASLGGEIAEAVAARLRMLHGTQGIDAPARPAGASLDAARRALRTLREAEIVEGARGDRILAALASRVPRPREPAAIHGDFHLHQILVGDEGPVFVDFERCGLGDPLQDVGNLVAHLRAYAGAATRAPGASSPWSGFEEGFVSAYLEGAESPRHPSDLAFFVACGLLEIALLRLRRIDPDFRDAAPRAVDLAEEALGEVEASTPAGARAIAVPFRSPLDALDREGMRWNILYPKTKRPWPGYLVDAAGEPVPGTYDPETVRFRALRPIDDPAIGGGKAWLDRGRVVAYRPGSRAVVRIPGGSSPLYAKLSRPSRARRSLAVHEAIRRLAAAAGSFPGFPEIVEAEPDAGVVVHRSVPGTPLHRFLIEGPSGDAVDRMAVAIASLHLVEPPADEVALAPRGSIPLRDWLSFVETHYPALAGPYREAHREIERARPHPFEGSLRIVHGDLHDKNVHLDGSRLYLLDLDSFSVGDPAVDAGNLAAHLVLRAIQRGETAEAGRLDANRFLEAYRRAGGTADSPRTRWERSASLFRLACVYLFRRRWRERAPELVTEARETLRSHGA